ncbi:GNAT family N-acetyltransferase [Psychrobacillus vulpis]|uniref:GNAT family N-acetyltransferase n=1 Tax=Psychrobacillus vulpis TaxID=2325572 RepID=UPI00140D70F2|nr:GNAT family N-acetyltransferase [Psychrobacillus vulpis]
MNNGEIIAFFPFLYENKGWLYKYNFIGFGYANYMDFISYKHSLEYVIALVLDFIIVERKSVVFYLHGLLESGFSIRRLEGYIRNREMTYSTHRVITPFIDLEKISKEEYLKKRKKLHRVDKNEKRMRESGVVEVLPTGPEHMETIFNLHHKRWKKKRDTSGFTNKKERKFYQSLAQLQEGPLTTEIDGLFMDGKMIAFKYGYKCRGRYVGYVISFEDDFKVFSPGRILEKDKILQCSKRGINIVDFSIGYEPYKFEWNTDIDYTRKIIFSSKSLTAQLLRLYLSLKELFISRIKLNRRLVLFKRNKIGKFLYVIKNILSKTEKAGVREEIAAFIHPKLNKLFEWKRYTIYEIASKNVPEDLEKDKYVELTIREAINNYDSVKEHMRDICTKIYGGYKGYYLPGHLSFENVFWTNEKVIRIDNIGYLRVFKKSSVHIENWRTENLAEICSYVKKISKANKIFISVKANLNKEISELEKIGFTIHQQIFKRTILGFSKAIFTNEKNSA